ncbi:MAG: JAB domain-containing protein [Bacteroidetes bacterium]|nr:MAG: JAB domain-containing protein [Bacteroidota bacterium]
MENYTNTPLPITQWAEDDRPREKLQLKGCHSLSDAELLAILLSSGSKDISAVALAQRILDQSKNNLNELGRRTIAELVTFKGIGPAKAIKIVAAMELARRRQLTAPLERPKISSSKAAFQQIGPLLADLKHEECWILFLNQGNKLLSVERISEGGMTGTVVDVRLVFRKAIERSAVCLILVHNHPSGELKPSQPDLDLTRKIKNAGALLDIRLLDHLIVSNQGYYSFADEGAL